MAIINLDYVSMYSEIPTMYEGQFDEMWKKHQRLVCEIAKLQAEKPKPKVKFNIRTEDGYDYI